VAVAHPSEEVVTFSSRFKSFWLGAREWKFPWEVREEKLRFVLRKRTEIRLVMSSAGFESIGG
jgi:hypothetical protein